MLVRVVVIFCLYGTQINFDGEERNRLSEVAAAFDCTRNVDLVIVFFAWFICYIQVIHLLERMKVEYLLVFFSFS